MCKHGGSCSLPPHQTPVCSLNINPGRLVPAPPEIDFHFLERSLGPARIRVHCEGHRWSNQISACCLWERTVSLCSSISFSLVPDKATRPIWSLCQQSFPAWSDSMLPTQLTYKYSLLSNLDSYVDYCQSTAKYKSRGVNQKGVSDISPTLQESQTKCVL